MKKTFKILCLGMILTNCVFFLSACKAKPRFDNDVMKENVVKVEIFKFPCATQFIDNVEVEIIKELDVQEMDELFSELSKIIFKAKIGMEPPYLGDYGITLYNKNGDRQIVCFSTTYARNDTQRANSASGRWECSEEEFKTLIAKFIDIDV